MAPRAAKRVFIFGGGATLGAHQVGALQHLEERGIRPDAIVGSSIGVVNACLYASGGVAHMREAWSSFRSLSRLFRPSLRHNPITGLSLFSMESLARAIEEFLDFETIHRSPLELCFVLLNLSRGEGQFVSNRGVHSTAEMRAVARAGYAIPLLFPPVRFRGEYFVDGGFAWNVPLLQAVEMGATEIYVLSVIATALPFKRRLRNFPDYLLRVADVMWRTLGNVGYVTTRIEPDGTYRGVPVTVVNPREEYSGFGLANLLISNPRRTRQLIAAGYRDAKRELARRDRVGLASGDGAEPLVDVEPAYLHEVA